MTTEKLRLARVYQCSYCLLIERPHLWKIGK
jgi:hypothetical protein